MNTQYRAYNNTQNDENSRVWCHPKYLTSVYAARKNKYLYVLFSLNGSDTLSASQIFIKTLPIMPKVDKYQAAWNADENTGRIRLTLVDGQIKNWIGGAQEFTVILTILQGESAAYFNNNGWIGTREEELEF